MFHIIHCCTVYGVLSSDTTFSFTFVQSVIMTSIPVITLDVDVIQQTNA